MLRTLKLAAAFAAASALGTAAAAADVVTYERVYTSPAPDVVYTYPEAGYVIGSPRIVTVPETVVTEPETVVTERYVVRRGRAYVAPETYARVVVRPPDCGVYHYWDGAACVDARVRPGVPVSD